MNLQTLGNKCRQIALLGQTGKLPLRSVTQYIFSTHPQIFSLPVSDRHNDRRGRSSFERSPDRPMRLTVVLHLSSDHYRPSAKQKSHPPGRSDYDSYRPHYDNYWSPPRRELMSPSGSHSRRDSSVNSHARTSGCFDTPPPPPTLRTEEKCFSLASYFANSQPGILSLDSPWVR